MLLRPVLMPILRNPLQGIADGIRNMLAELLGSSQFFAPLTHSLVLSRGTGSPTFTRATTATVKNNDGYLVTALAGEVRFEGARRVRNLAGNSNDLNNAYFTKSNVGTGVLPVVTSNYAADPIDGVVRASRLVLDIGAGTGAGDISRLYMNGGTGISNCATQFYAKSNTANSYVVDIGGGGVNRYVTITPNWQLFTPAIFTSYPTIMLQGGTACSQYADISVCRYQNEDVTAQTTQTAGEYVSVGVESAPYYHGSFVDGVKCFPTDINGTPITDSTLKGYLAEGARENLCLQSQTFDSWTDSGASVTANTTVAPDGTTTADTIVRVSGQSDARYVTQTLVSNAVHAVSLWIKKGTSPSSLITLYDVTAVTYRLFADVTWSGTTPVFAFTNGSLIRSTEWANGLWRVELLTEAVVAANTNRLYIYPGRAGSANGETVIAWGAQVELGSFASSYIPTTTAAVTRNADVLTYPSAGNIDGTKGWCYAEINGSNVSYLSTDGAYYVTSDTSSDSPILYNVPVPPGKLSTFDGTSIINGDAITANIKGCVSWGGTSRSISVNGGTPVSGAFDGAIITGSSIGIGHKVGGITSAYGTIRNLRIGQRQLSASEMQAITAQ